MLARLIYMAKVLEQRLNAGQCLSILIVCALLSKGWRTEAGKAESTDGTGEAFPFVYMPNCIKTHVGKSFNMPELNELKQHIGVNIYHTIYESV